MKPRLVSVGEILWDLLPSGPQLGGAPCNLACHAAALGGDARLVSRVGNDERGRTALDLLARRGVDLAAVALDDAAPTGTVAVELDPDGQPRFTIHERVAWDRLTADAASLAAVAQADAVCFGSLAQRTPEARAAVHRLLAAAPRPCLILFDINLRPPFYEPSTLEASLAAAGVLKLNETELPALADLFGLTGPIEARVESLARRFDLDTVVLTLGGDGSRVWTAGSWTHEPARPVEVRDTVGAGDAFTAAFVMGRLLGWPTAATVRAATELAAYVCTRPGATPELPSALVAPYRAPA